MELRDYIKIDGNFGFLKLRIIPNAQKTIIAGPMADGVLKIRINSIPEKSKANKELISFISKNLDIKKANIEIVSGLTSQNKILRIDL